MWKALHPQAKAATLAALAFLFYQVVSLSRPLARSRATCTVDKIGGNPNNDMYGAWYVCANMIQAPATLISVGSGCDSSFEQAFLEAFPGSIVHVLDPTITHHRFVQCAKSSSDIATHHPNLVSEMNFWRVGLSNETKMVAFNKSPDPRIGSKSEVQLANYAPDGGDMELVVDMNTMYTMLGIASPPILKIDVEGSEYKVLQRFCAEGHRLKHARPTQILIEFHDRLMQDDLSFGRLDAYECLKKAGYRLEYESPRKEEVLFARPPLGGKHRVM